MSRVWATARVLAALAVTIFGAYWIFYALGRWARWSGYSPDEQARLKADRRRLRVLGEPDHFDVLPEPAAPAFGTWTHPHGSVTVIRPSGSACGSCGQEEPA